jgi:hypothetical protein
MRSTRSEVLPVTGIPSGKSSVVEREIAIAVGASTAALELGAFVLIITSATPAAIAATLAALPNTT